MIRAMTTGNSENAPVQRIGFRERDAAVERLRVAAGEGQITLDELDARMEAALAARTAGEIAVLVADLPVPAGVSAALEPVAPLRLSYAHSSMRRLGVWRVPGQISLDLRHSACVLDLRTPTLPPGGVHIELDARHSSVKLLVAADAHVDIDGVSRHHSGTKDRGARRVSAWGGPMITVTGTLHHSMVKVLRPGETAFGRLTWRRRTAELTTS